MAPIYRPPVPFSQGVTLNAEGTGQYPAGGPFGGFQFKGVTITSAQILALNSTPIQIIAAPTSKQILVPHFAVIRYNFGTVGYAGTTGVLQLRLGTLSPLTPTLTTFSTANIGATASSIELAALGTAAVSSAPPPTTTVAGLGLFALLSAANATTGDGTLHITVYYNTDTST